MDKFNFRMVTETDRESGKILAMYFQVRKGKATEVKELVDGTAFANYDRKGRLLGLELLGPCTVTVIERIIHDEPTKIRRFVKDNIPRKMAMSR
jgi:uncharacterized protein YuzE